MEIGTSGSSPEKSTGVPAAGSSQQAAANALQQQVNGSGPKQQEATASAFSTEEPAEKLLITGDDVLIEYVTRLIIAVKSFTEGSLRNNWRMAMESFITHYVWHTSDMRRADNNK